MGYKSSRGEVISGIGYREEAASLGLLTARGASAAHRILDGGRLTSFDCEVLDVVRSALEVEASALESSLWDSKPQTDLATAGVAGLALDVAGLALNLETAESATTTGSDTDVAALLRRVATLVQEFISKQTPDQARYMRTFFEHMSSAALAEAGASGEHLES